MKPNTQEEPPREASGDEQKRPWAALILDDMIGIDRDIEKLIGLFQADSGCARREASAALMKRLSVLAGSCFFLVEDSCFS
jgi:hypothetical protein